MANLLSNGSHRPTTEWMIEAAKRLLEGEGYIVTLAAPFRERLTPKELADKAGLSPAGLHRRLHHRDCPDFDADLGTTGRIISIRPTPAVLAFLTKPKNPGKMHKEKGMPVSQE